MIIVEAVGECVMEAGERMVLEDVGVLRGSGETMVLAGLCMAEDERERMEGCGRGGTGEGWELVE
jgi:hypothetical protein